MSTGAAQAHEHDAIEGLCEAFERNGRPARVVSWPDTDPTEALTVDAIAEIAGGRWVIEHSRLTVSNSFHRARKETLAALHGPLEVPLRFGFQGVECEIDLNDFTQPKCSTGSRTSRACPKSGTARSEPVAASVMPRRLTLRSFGSGRMSTASR